MVSNVSAKSPLRYPGGKSRARKILASFVPNNVGRIFSPFLGGGSFELFMTSQGVTVSACDGFGHLVNFWEHLLSVPHELAEAISPYLGSVDAAVFKRMQEELSAFGDNNEGLGLAEAAKFYVINRSSFSASTLCGGFSRAAAKGRFTASSIDNVRSFRNPLISVTYGRFEDTLINVDANVDLLFVDPPYALEGAQNSLYGVKGSLHKGFDHERLQCLLMETDKPFILTYNECDYVRSLWEQPGVRIIPAEWSYGMNTSKKSSEVIIMNYDYSPSTLF